MSQKNNYSNLNEKESTFWRTKTAFSTTKLSISDIKLPLDYKISPEPISYIPCIINLLKENYIKQEDYALIYENKLLERELKEGYRICLFFKTHLIGFIHLKFIHLSIFKETKKTGAINFLCLENKYRNKGLAPSLISYAQAMANSENVMSAVFTGNKNLPNYFMSTSYLHKLLPTPIKIREGIETYKEKDTLEILNLLKERKTNFHEEFLSPFEFYKKFKTEEDCVYSLVYKENNKIKEFGSYFTIRTQNKEYTEKNAYLYFLYSESKEILIDMFSLATRQNCYMFNLLDYNKNNKLIERMELFEGTGRLNYHLFNYKNIDINKEDVDFTLI